MPGFSNNPADISVLQGKVPLELPDPVWSSPFVSVSSGGATLVRAETVGRCLVEQGRSITLEANPAAQAVEIEGFLMGPVAGVLLHQRGILPLHASCVRTGGVAIALTGRAGSGKSSVAAALLQRGATLMSDDICPVVFGADGLPTAIPGSVGLRLWPDSREVLGGGTPGWSPIRQGHAKHVVPACSAESLSPVPLGAMIRLVPAQGSAPEIRRLSGPPAVMPLANIVYHMELGRALGRGEGIFRDAVRVANQVPTFELHLPYGFVHLEATTSLILNAAGARV